MASGATRQIEQTTNRNWLNALVTTGAVMAALYFGRDLLVPFAVASLLSFLLSTPLIWLEKRHIPRPAAVSVVLMFAMACTAGLIWMAVNEFGGMLTDWPKYQQNINGKVQAIQGAPGAGIQNLERTFRELKQDFSLNPENTEATDKPVPVKVIGGSTLISSLGFAGATAAQLLAEAFAIFILTLFILLNREQLRDRVLRLFGEGKLIVLTTTFDEAASRVSRYLLSQFSVNGAFGLILFIGLTIIGVPYAPLWGAFVLILRFVPYIGTLVAGFCPFIMALAAFDGWHKPLETLCLYVALELTISSFIEPWLYANRTGISSVAYLLSAAFWTLIWGPIGLVLSTPLTVCLVVLGRHLPPLEFLNVLLGDEPALTEDLRFYQRLLAEDEDETATLLETAAKTQPLVQVYDRLVIPALSTAEQDRHEGRLSDEKAGSMYEMAREIIEIAGERHPCPEADGIKAPLIICMGTRDQADEVVAGMVVQMIRQCGGKAEPRHDLRPEDDFVVLSALPPFAMLHARGVCKRIRTEHPQVRILLGIWGSETPAEVIQERLGAACADWVVTSLDQALQVLTFTTQPEVPETVQVTS